MRSIYYLPLDTLDLLLGRRDKFVPPRGMILSDYGFFKQIGEEFFGYFKDLAELKPNERVLDIGCGIGRMAVPLTKYLDRNGSYEGFDIVADGINWCSKKITPHHPNFNFQLADIFNSKYNPNGKYLASEYKFPYESESFDFIFLTSVFTHMLPDDVDHYFSEIRRVLKNGGRCLITFFLLNEESLQLVNDKKSTLNFKHDFGKYRVIDTHVQEAAICYDEALVLDLFHKYELKIRPPIHYGSWCGRPDFLSYQDIIVAGEDKRQDTSQ